MESKVHNLVDHFFRKESGKMIAVLTKLFGSNNLLLAEDIVQETLIEAINNWTYNGLPQNPTAWLYQVAKNKSLNAIKREGYQKKYVRETLNEPHTPQNIEINFESIFSEKEIFDDQLRMMFMCCHPSISPDSQIALILKTLCGFSISEIAKAFLTNNDNINKRLVRARKTIRQNKIQFEVPNKKDIADKLEVVLEAIYLLFNEGYSASSGEQLIRKELCEEAIRLSQLIADSPLVNNKSNVYALLALMQLNASRFNAREPDLGVIHTLEHQDRSLWDFQIMEKGFNNLKLAAEAEYISSYHILASISAYHCSARDFQSSDWNSILTLYNKLLLIKKSPVILLNRAICLSKLGFVEDAIEELNNIRQEKSMQSNYLFHCTMAEFSFQLEEFDKGIEELKKAITLAPTHAEKTLLESRYKKYFREN